MAFLTMADNGIDISARQDGALYNASVGGDFVLKGIGNELSFSVSGLNVTVETGEAIIHGRHITAEESNTITLPSNSSGYLVLRLDLSQTSGNEAYLYATPVLTTEEVNWNGVIHDLAIATFTSTSTTASLIDARRIVASTMGGSNITIESDGKPYINYVWNGKNISKKLGSVEGTANASDVLSGATFMSASSDEIQTGTLALSGNASASDVRKGKTFYNTNAKSKQTGTMVSYATGSKTLAQCRSEGLTPCTVRLSADIQAYASRGDAGKADGSTSFTCVSGGSTYTITTVNTHYSGNSSGHCTGTLASGQYVDVEHLGLSVCKNITSFSIDCTVTRWAIQ